MAKFDKKLQRNARITTIDRQKTDKRDALTTDDLDKVTGSYGYRGYYGYRYY